MATPNPVPVNKFKRKCQLCDKKGKLRCEMALQCSRCRNNFHLACLGIVTPDDLDRFICRSCENNNANEKTIIADSHLSFLKVPPEEDLENFITGVRGHDFLEADEMPVRRLSGQKGDTLDVDYLEKHGFSEPILVESMEQLEMTVNYDSLTPEALRNALGDLWQLQVLSVTNQREGMMYLREFATHFGNVSSEEIICSLSLELSRTKLKEMIEPPKVVRSISWVTVFWKCKRLKPYTDRYLQHCKAGSFTNFHIDGGGSSIWHHVCKGKEELFLIKPTDDDCDELQKYEDWIIKYKAEAQPRSFLEFANPPGRCFRVEVCQGQTIFVPGGYIRATFYPEDAIVVGGNFLHGYNMENQIRCYKIEKNCGTESIYRLPDIECIYWQVAYGIVNRKGYKDEKDAEILRNRAIVLNFLLKLLREFPEDGEFPYKPEYVDKNTIVSGAQKFIANHGGANGDQEENQCLDIDRHAGENAADSEEGDAEGRRDITSKSTQEVDHNPMLRFDTDRPARENAADGNSEEGDAEGRRDITSKSTQEVDHNPMLRFDTDRPARENAADGNSEEGDAEDRRDITSKSTQEVDHNPMLRFDTDRPARENAADGNSEEGDAEDRRDTSTKNNQPSSTLHK